MSPVIDRLAELRRHLDHLRELRPRVPDPEVLSQDLSLHNDVLFSLQTVCQVVIDIASELSARRKLRFQDYTEAVRNLAAFSGFPPAMVRGLEKHVAGLVRRIQAGDPAAESELVARALQSRAGKEDERRLRVPAASRKNEERGESCPS